MRTEAWQAVVSCSELPARGCLLRGQFSGTGWGTGGEEIIMMCQVEAVSVAVSDAGGRAPCVVCHRLAPHWVMPTSMDRNRPVLCIKHPTSCQRQLQAFIREAEVIGHSDCSRQCPAPSFTRALIRAGAADVPSLWIQASLSSLSFRTRNF